MPRPKWLLPNDRPSQPVVHTAMRFDRAFLAALRQRAQEESDKLRSERPPSRKQKVRVSQSTLLMTLALHADRRLKELYKQNLEQAE